MTITELLERFDTEKNVRVSSTGSWLDAEEGDDR